MRSSISRITSNLLPPPHNNGATHQLRALNQRPFLFLGFHENYLSGLYRKQLAHRRKPTAPGLDFGAQLADQVGDGPDAIQALGRHAIQQQLHATGLGLEDADGQGTVGADATFARQRVETGRASCRERV